jgi:hypothetical protein
MEAESLKSKRKTKKTLKQNRIDRKYKLIENEVTKNSVNEGIIPMKK